MKKLLIILLIFLFLPFISAWEYDHSYKYGCARAYAMLSGTYPECEGTQYLNKYCVGRWYTELNYAGDQFKIFYEATSWPELKKTGIVGGESIDKGRHYIDFDGEFKKFILCAWDRDDCGSDWAWSGKCGGYFGEGVLDNKRNIECYKDVDCYSNEYCDRGGSWRDWNCKAKECDTGETKCEGNEFYDCKSYKWNNVGIKKGECGVECIDDKDCKDDEYIGDKFCLNVKEVGQTYRSYFCEDYECGYIDEDKLIEECNDMCEKGECINRTWWEKNSNTIIIYSLGVGILTLLSLITYKLIKRYK